MIRWFVTLIFLLCCRNLTGAETAKAVPLRILTSLVPLYSWTTSIVGDLAVVENLLPASIGPHDFRLRPADVKRILSADVIILNGLGIESAIEVAIKNNAGTRDRRLLRTTDGLEREFIYRLPLLQLDSPGSVGQHHDEGPRSDLPNPHLWLDPVYARHAVSNILPVLCARDPRNAAGYQKNAAAYQEELAKLDHDFQALSAPLKHKPIVTYHDAFPYFARRYGFELVGVVEQNPSVEPSARYLSDLLKVIKSRNVQVIFTEPQFEPRLIKQLSRDVGVEVAELDVLETGPLRADFYIHGMRKNLRTLKEALK